MFKELVFRIREKIKNTLVTLYKKIKEALKERWRKKIHWRDIINFSNFIKLFSIYAMVIVYLMVAEIEYSPGFWKQVLTMQRPETRLSVYSSRGRSGEDLVYERALEVSRKLGWQYSGIKFNEGISQIWCMNFLYQSATSIINFIFQPSFNLLVTHHIKVYPYGYNISYLNVPNDMIFDKSGEFKEIWKYLERADAYLDLYTYVNGYNQVLQDALGKLGQKYKMVYPYYLAVNKRPYVKMNTDVLKPVIIGSLWGCNRNSLRVSLALKKISEENLLVAYGHSYALGFLGNNYKGKIEDFKKDAPAEEAMMDMYRHFGVSLSLHSLEHYMEGLPTSRVMEAVSAGAIVISDDHPFFVKHFPDSMLFVNTLTNTEEVYSQIKKHILWIQQNKEEAANKARIAHQIFLQHFTMEEQLGALAKEVISNR